MSDKKFAVINLEPFPAHSLGAAERRYRDNEALRTMSEDAITDARTDSEIAREFISHGELGPKSMANTQKELFRFLTWCREEAGKTLRQLTVADLNSYKDFLKAPPAEWICTTKWPRSDPRYRPFSGPLSDASRRQAMIAVKGLFAYAAQTGYLRRDPAALVKHVKTASTQRITRYLTQDALKLAVDTIATQEAPTPAAIRRRARDHFLLSAYIHTGARLNEIVSADMGALYSEGNGRWWLDVVGKGNKPRRLPVPPDMLAAFRQYRIAFGLLPHTVRADQTPLVLSSRAKNPARITDEAASDALKAIFAAAANAAAATGDADMAATLRQASAHWLRHSMLTNHANNGVQLKTLQDTAGHASIATTAAYLHKTDHERHDEILGSLAGRVDGG
ncbi:MAG: tyrosine-type recombinase/integrase [Duganella sp.]